MMFEMPHPVESRIPQLGFPYKFSDAAPSARLRPPLLGEHAETILSQELGMGEAEIRKLMDEKVVIGPADKGRD
jgi:crotonobetainyl-CoA:carnitine CoA-transferase CaiB-like acyl-CoA transferase